jgi:hypothetical protein
MKKASDLIKVDLHTSPWWAPTVIVYDNDLE